MQHRHFSLLLLLLLAALLATSDAVSGRKLHAFGNAPRFKLKQYPGGGAAKFLEDVDKAEPGIVSRILKNSNLPDRLKLVKKLNGDDDLGVDLTSERLIFQCAGLVVPAAAAAGPSSVFAAAAAASELGSSLTPSATDPQPNQAFNLSSRPYSLNKIWLDFRGSTWRNTAWNTAYNRPTITVPIFDFDSPASTTFSQNERRVVIATWRQVAEDYAPFDIDVTTIPVPNTYDKRRYTRVAIGGSSSGVLGIDAGGIAYAPAWGINSLTYQPAFIFPANLGGGSNSKYLAEAISHEVGHNFNLGHDGTSSTGYYTGANGWAPLMGVGYYQPLTQWSKGDYADANNCQDDLGTIAGYIGYIPQNNGNSMATATPLTVTSSTATTFTARGNGIISQTGQLDYFSVNVPSSGVLSLSVAGVAYTDLPVQATVYDPNGNQIGTPINTIDYSGTLGLTGLGFSGQGRALPRPGVYVVTVTGVGYQDAANYHYGQA